MQHAVLCDGDTFRLERWGGGLSYQLTHKPSGRSAFAQGDDAEIFDREFSRCAGDGCNATIGGDDDDGCNETATATP